MTIICILLKWELLAMESTRWRVWRFERGCLKLTFCLVKLCSSTSGKLIVGKYSEIKWIWYLQCVTLCHFCFGFYGSTKPADPHILIIKKKSVSYYHSIIYFTALFTIFILINKIKMVDIFGLVSSWLTDLLFAGYRNLYESWLKAVILKHFGHFLDQSPKIKLHTHHRIIELLSFIYV